jgi:hypothetical protein
MPFMAAKCTNCGAAIKVDDSKEAGICNYCGTAFITEKVINHYNTTIHQNFAGANVTIQGGHNIDALVKRARIELEGGHLEAAAAACDKISDIDIENPDLWLFRLLIEAESKDLKELSRTFGDFTNTKAYKKAVQLNPAKKEEIQKAANAARCLSHFIINGAVLNRYAGFEKDIVIPQGVGTIGQWTDDSPENYLDIKSGAFEGCSGITSVTIPESVIFIESNAFKGCVNVANIYIHAGIASIGYGAFSGWGKNQTITLSVTHKKSAKKYWGGWDRNCKAKIVYK